MKTIRKILIVTGLEDSSPDVIEYGLTLGLMLGASIKCIYFRHEAICEEVLIDESLEQKAGTDNGKTTIDERSIMQDLDTLQCLVGVIQESFADIGMQIETEVKCGAATNNILKEINEWGADLVIMGMFTNMENIQNAIVPKDIILLSQAHVMIFPSSRGNLTLEKVGVFIQFQFEEIVMVLDMINIAKENNLDIIFLHQFGDVNGALEVNRKLKLYQKLFEEDIKSGFISFKLSVQDCAQTITELPENDGVDLFVTRLTESQKTSNVSSHFFELLQDIKVPTLIWKDR
jgi:nucleotide-binding universal stress UspA family protein